MQMYVSVISRRESHVRSIVRIYVLFSSMLRSSRLANLVERESRKRKVVGSRPLRSFVFHIRACLHMQNVCI